MNQSSDELAALGRIIQVIKRFSQTVSNAQTAGKRLKDAYLKRHLSEQDWLFWKQLQTETDPQETPANNQGLMLNQTLSSQQFSLLLNQYRRAGFESYQLWYQAQKKSILGIGDPLPPC